MNQHFVYAKYSDEEKIVGTEEYFDLLNTGEWVDTPAKREERPLKAAEKPKKTVKKEKADDASNDNDE